MKPKIYKKNGAWECRGGGMLTFAGSPEKAYKCWLIKIGRLFKVKTTVSENLSVSENKNLTVSVSVNDHKGDLSKFMGDFKERVKGMIDAN